MNNPGKTLISYTKEDILAKVGVREGEVKLGEKIKFLGNSDIGKLSGLGESGVKYALLGIPESIGPIANMGKSGAENAWEVFLSSFLNIQSNRYLTGGEILCLGEINTKYLQKKSDQLNPRDKIELRKLRDLCGQLDEMVSPVVEYIAAAGLIPIIVGGGHNNAFPILKGVTKGLNLPNGINCLNCDPHADFRTLEGRHSGNGFSYAFEEGYLHQYFAMGLHEIYNSEKMLQAMDKRSSRIAYSFFKGDFASLLKGPKAFFKETEIPVGLELDLDSIKGMPVSAYTPSGISVEEARQFLVDSVSSMNIAYLHLPEGAPCTKEDKKILGKTLSYLVTDFIKGHKKRINE